MEELRFANLVKDIIVDSGVAEHAIASSAAADRCLLIFFTPRSGSSWLSKIIVNTQRLGTPEEYINPEFIPFITKKMHATSQATLLGMLKRWTKTKNGIFSMEVRAIDVELFGETEFFAAFDPSTVIFFLWRDNIVGQGISLYRAVSTNRFHSDVASVAPPAYDVEKIAEWMRHIVQIENDNLTLLRRRDLPIRFLRYEEIVRDRETTLAILADALRVDLTEKRLVKGREAELHKIADEWNRAAEQRFREERRDFIYEIEAQRLIRQSP
jgi:LPS sulfotransferase NodH